MINEYDIFSLASTRVFSTLALYNFLVLLCGGTIKREITGKRQNKGGSRLNDPCKLITL